MGKALVRGEIGISAEQGSLSGEGIEIPLPSEPELDTREGLVLSPQTGCSHKCCCSILGEEAGRRIKAGTQLEQSLEVLLESWGKHMETRQKLFLG